MIVAFDALAAARVLEAAGIGRDRAEAIAAVARDAADAGRDDAATKTDVAGLKTDLAGVKTDLAAVKADVAGLKTGLAAVKVDVAELKAEFKGDLVMLTWRMVGLAAVVVAAVKLIPSP